MEIMVAIVIAGIITTIGVLGFRKTINHQKLKGESGRAMSKLRYISDEARVSKKRVGVYSNFTHNVFYAWFDDNANGVFDTGETMLDSMRVGPGIRLLAGKRGSELKSGEMFFTIYGDGAPSIDIRLALYSIETKEFKGILMRQTSGWVEEYELTSGEKTSLATYINK
jgi:hypothetical protein